jgi:competence protein ComEA
MKRPSPFLLALVLATSGFAIAIGAQTAPAADASEVAPAPHTWPDAPGKATVQMVCGACHSPDYITDAPRNSKGWNDVFEMMQAYGATATDDEWKEIKGYILGHIAQIEVNKATAAELQATFEIDEPTAKAIIDYRTANGDFKTIDDVKKVAGLDAKKVDYRKNRLEF